MKLFVDGRIINDVSWGDIVAALGELRDNDIFLYLQVVPVPSKGPWRLDIQSSDDGYFLLMIAESDKSGPRVYVNPHAEGKVVEIGGYDVNDGNLTKDFDLVIHTTKEFFETGDVSKDILK